MSARRLKILLSAYACEPGLGSEPGLGWNTLVQALRRHEVWVLTADEHRPGIERYLGAHPLPGAHWVYVEPPRALVPLDKYGKGRRVHYYLWQVTAFRRGRALQREIGFDVVHHITYSSYWTPSFLARLPVPFLWGPVGGAESAPHSFYATLSPKSRRTEWLRDAARLLAHRGDPFVRDTARRARITLAATHETENAVRQLGARDIRIVSNAALAAEDMEQFGAVPVRAESHPFRIFSMGRLIGWKAFHLGLQAFARFHQRCPESEYLIAGSGPEQPRLEQLARDLGVADCVQFTGKVPRTQVMAELGRCDVMLHPTLHDSGGWASVEAMAARRPIVCLALGGPAVVVSEAAGIRAAAPDPETAVAGMAAALERLASSPDMRRQMGEAGRQHVCATYTWDQVGERFEAMYREMALTP